MKKLNKEQIKQFFTIKKVVSVITIVTLVGGIYYFAIQNKYDKDVMYTYESAADKVSELKSEDFIESVEKNSKKNQTANFSLKNDLNIVLMGQEVDGEDKITELDFITVNDKGEENESFAVYVDYDYDLYNKAYGIYYQASGEDDLNIQLTYQVPDYDTLYGYNYQIIMDQLNTRMAEIQAAAATYQIPIMQYINENVEDLEVENKKYKTLEDFERALVDSIIKNNPIKYYVVTDIKVVKEVE